MAINLQIIDRFKADGDRVWAAALSVIDCLVVDSGKKDYRIKTDDEKEVRKNFLTIGEDEEILFIRDLTFWNSRSQGCVITDRALYFIMDKAKPEDIFDLKWSDISTVRIDNGNFCFVMCDGTNHLIDANFLMKEKNPGPGMLKRIASFLREIAESESGAESDADAAPEKQSIQSHVLPPKKGMGGYLTDVGKLVTGVTAVENRKAAKSKKEEADRIMKETTHEIDQIRYLANDRLEAFGCARCEMLKTTVGRFLRINESLNRRAKDKVYELSSSFSLRDKDFQELETVEMNASNMLATAASSGSIAAIACSGIPAAVTSVVGAACSAGTGTAISSLSGAAATNATLAWLGGGTVAAGGGGVAAGATILAGIKIAATGFGALIGAAMIAGQIYSKKHTEAEKYLAEVKQWRAKSLAAAEIMKGVVKRSDELFSVTLRLEGRIIPVLDELEALVPVFNPREPAHVKIYQRAQILVKSMSELAQTPLIDIDGNLSKQSAIAVEKTQQILNHDLLSGSDK